MQSQSRNLSACWATLIGVGLATFATPSFAQDACILPVRTTVPTIDGNVDGLNNTTTADPAWYQAGAPKVPPITTYSQSTGRVMTLQFQWNADMLYIAGIVNNTAVQVGGTNQSYDTIVLGLAGSANDVWRFVVQPILLSEPQVPYYYGTGGGAGVSPISRLILGSDPATQGSSPLVAFPATAFYVQDTTPSTTGAWTTAVTNGATFGTWLDPGSGSTATGPFFAYGATPTQFEFEISIPISKPSSPQNGVHLLRNFRAYVDFVATDLTTAAGAVTDQYAWPATATIATSTAQSSGGTTIDITDARAIPYLDKWAAVNMTMETSCPAGYLSATADDIGTKPADANGNPDPHFKIPPPPSDCTTATTTPGPENDLIAHLHNGTSTSVPVTASFSWAAWGWTGAWTNFSSGWQDAGTQSVTANPNSPAVFGDPTNIPLSFTQAQACQFHLADPAVTDPHPCMQVAFTAPASSGVAFDPSMSASPGVPAGMIGAYVQKNMIWQTTQSPLVDQAVLDARGFAPPPGGAAQQSFMLSVDQQIVPQERDAVAFKTHPPSPCSPADPAAGSALCCAKDGSNPRCGQAAPAKWETLEYVVRGQRMTGNYLTIKGKKFQLGEKAGQFGLYARHFLTAAEAQAPAGTVRWGSQLASAGGTRLTPVHVNSKVAVAGHGSIGQETYMVDIPVNGSVGVITNLIGGADATQPPPPPVIKGPPGPPPVAPCNCRNTGAAAGSAFGGVLAAAFGLLVLYRRRNRRPG